MEGKKETFIILSAVKINFLKKEQGVCFSDQLSYIKFKKLH